MEIVLTRATLVALMADAAEIALKAAFGQLGLIKPYLCKQEAYDRFSRSDVDRWIKEGLITPRKDGEKTAKWRIDRVELEIVAKASNRPSYKSVSERKK